MLLRMKLRPAASAFSLVEILVAISLSAALFSAAALIYQAISFNANPLGNLYPITFPEGTLANLYGLDQNTINVYTEQRCGLHPVADGAAVAAAFGRK